MTRISGRSCAVAALLMVPAGLALQPAVTPPSPPMTAASATTTATATATATAPAPAPLYSAPTYLPLRAPARVSCVKDNCRLPDGRVYHNDWAIDFLGAFGDPIYPAGNGVVYVGGRVTGCRDTSEARGNWVWVDHGGGELTKYYHLQKILVKNGQRVTVDTELGEMGGTGQAQCRVAYLHFERRVTNKESVRVEPATMWGCLAGKPVGYPQANGFRTWNMPKLQQWVQSTGTGCLTRPPRAGRPTLVSVRSNNARDGAVLKWTPPLQNPQLVTRYRVSVSLWHPTSNEWDASPVFHTVAGTATSVTIPGLQFQRTYRLRIAAADRAGASPWSDSRDVIIAKPPAAPPIAKLKVGPRWILAKWTIPPNGGNRITAYRAELRRGTTVVRRSQVSSKVRDITWSGLPRKTSYTVAVVAINQVGTSPESRRRASTT